MAKIELNDRERAAKNAYLREWRRKNPDKVKRYNKEHFRRLADRMETEAQNSTDTPAAANE